MVGTSASTAAIGEAAIVNGMFQLGSGADALHDLRWALEWIKRDGIPKKNVPYPITIKQKGEDVATVSFLAPNGPYEFTNLKDAKQPVTLSEAEKAVQKVLEVLNVKKDDVINDDVKMTLPLTGPSE